MSKAAAGASITLTAEAEVDYLFARWVVVSGGITLTSATAATLTFVMPANEVSIKAEFEAYPTDVFTALTDPAFKSFCARFDTDGDGKLSYAEAQAVIRIDLYTEGITNIESLAGIQYFTSLTYLDFTNNLLATLDVSKNTALETLYFTNNPLTNLDVSGCTALISLCCYGNASLSKVMVWSAFDIDEPTNSIANIRKDDHTVFERKQ